MTTNHHYRAARIARLFTWSAIIVCLTLTASGDALCHGRSAGDGDSNDQNGCESAWARGTTRFREHGNWASYYSIPNSPGTTSKRLIAGQHTDVGAIIATVSANDVTVQYALDLSRPWDLTKADLYAGTQPPIKSAPGRFPYHSGSIVAKTYTFTIPRSTLGSASTLYLAAHGEVCPDNNLIPVDLGTATASEAGGTLSFPGLEIQVDPGAIRAPVTFHVELVPPPAPLPARVTEAGRSVRISLLAGQHALEMPIRLKFSGLTPDSDPTTQLTVIHFNEVVHKYEPLTMESFGDAEVVVDTRSFSTFTPAELALGSPPSYLLPGFTPDRKGWSIINSGSNITLGGNCAGMSSYAAWLYDAHPSDVLFTKYTGDFAEVLASRAQVTQISWWTTFDLNALAVTEETMGLYARAALSTFEDPLLLWAFDSFFAEGGHQSSHLLVIFGYDDGGFFFYDPNAPGAIRYLGWNYVPEHDAIEFDDYDFDGLHYDRFVVLAEEFTGSYPDFQQLYDEAERGFNGPPITVTDPVNGGDVDLCETPVSGTVSDPNQLFVTVFSDGTEFDPSVIDLGAFEVPHVALAPGDNRVFVLTGEDLDHHSAFGPTAAARSVLVHNTGGPVRILDVTPRGARAAGTVGDLIQFTTQHAGTPSSYFWLFDGVEPSTSSDAEPLVTAVRPGTLTGEVFASNACGSTELFEFVFKIADCPSLIVLGVSPSDGFTGRRETFVFSSSGNPNRFSWNFGGGASPNTTFEESPTVTLGSPGTYHGSIEIGDACQRTDRLDFTLTVRPPGCAPSCDDLNFCTDDSCTQAGCTHTNNTRVCGDVNSCGTCSGGDCRGQQSCDDSNDCTDDSCDSVAGCVHVNNDNNPCGNACTNGDDVCSGGVCAGGVLITCDDGDPGTTDCCNPVTGCVHSDSGDPGVNVCDDGDPSTADCCDPSSGCRHNGCP